MKNTPRYKTVYVLRGGSWRLENNLKFNTFEELKAYLINNTGKIFSWICDHRFLPDFTQVETVRDINIILDDYNYDWWYIKVKIIAVEDENNLG